MPEARLERTREVYNDDYDLAVDTSTPCEKCGSTLWVLPLNQIAAVCANRHVRMPHRVPMK